MSDRRSRILALLVTLVAVAAALAGGWLVTAAIDLPTGPDDYNLVRWEVRHLPSKWLYRVGTFLRGGPNEVEKNRRVQRFLALNAEIASLEREAALSGDSDDPADGNLTIVDELATRRRERDRSFPSGV